MSLVCLETQSASAQDIHTMEKCRRYGVGLGLPVVGGVRIPDVPAENTSDSARKKKKKKKKSIDGIKMTYQFSEKKNTSDSAPRKSVLCGIGFGLPSVVVLVADA